MHYLAIALVPPPKKTNDINAITQFIDLIMEPYSVYFEHDCINTDKDFDDNEECDTCSDAFFDWYEIGGRWSGILTGYDPQKDPTNLSPCSFCASLGYRASNLNYDSSVNAVLIPCFCVETLRPGLIQASRLLYHGDIVTLGYWKKISKTQETYPCYLVTYENHLYRIDDFISNSSNIKTELDDILTNYSDDLLVAIIDCHM
jgi:hypothetical protein